MPLRSSLVVVLLLAALVPMAVAIAVPLVRAERRAREETLVRLEIAREQARALATRLERDVEAAAALALEDLVRSDDGMRSVQRGPQPAARSVADALSRRHGLDGVVISASDGVLAESLPEGLEPGPLPPATTPGVTVLGAGPSAPAVLAASAEAEVPGERLRLVGLKALRRDELAAIASITGGSVALIGPGGDRILESGEPRAGPEASIPFGGSEGGWSLRIALTPSDASEMRRDALRVAAGIAPIAVLAAFLLASVLAQRVSTPIRSLAERFDDLSRRRAGAAFEVVEDPNELRRLERAFERMLEGLDASERSRLSAERIAAWQEVARRIAHEVKNPLSPIRVAVENLLRTKERAPSDLARAVEEEGKVILDEVESLRRLVDEFSAFARLPAPTFAPCDPAGIARQAVGRIEERAARLGVEVRLDLDRAPAEISADAEQLGRALRNVLENALDAVEASARREIRVAVRRAPGRRGPVAEFEVADTGGGLDAEARRRIFEPYFTTKSDRGGTGLGMAIVYRIAAEHGGEALADGAPGRGTVITIRVPERAATLPG